MRRRLAAISRSRLSTVTIVRAPSLTGQPSPQLADVEYSTFSHYAAKGFDLDDWEEVYRFACSYFKIDIANWLDKEISRARAVQRYRDAFKAVETEMFPKPPDSWGGYCPGDRSHIHKQDAVAAELARRGILDPDGPIGVHNKLIV
jgi:hypothetical protein